MHTVDGALAARTTPYPTRSASRSPLRASSSKTMGLYNSNHEKSRNPWPGNRWAATAAALSVRVIYQSASTAPCCVHLVFPLTRSTSATMLPSKGTRQPNTNERQILSTTTIRLFSIGSRFLIIFSFLWAIIQQLVHRVSSNMICDGATCVSLSTCVTPGISHDPHPEGEL